MTANEIFTLLIALTSLAISLRSATRTHSLNEYQLRLNTRNEFQKMLMEVSKTMVADPELWAVYDSHPLSGGSQKDPKKTAKIESLAYMMLNTFEAVLAFYEDSPQLREAEQASFKSWKRYFREFIVGSSTARRLLEKAKDSEIYHKALMKEFELVAGDMKKLTDGPPAKEA